MVIDLDHKPAAGIDGIAAWRELAAGRPTPGTWTVRTPTGGLHLYYAVPVIPGSFPLRNTAGQLAPGIDTRAVGGYVVAPPTTLAGRPSTVASPAPVTPPLAWLAARLRPAPLPAARPVTVPLAADTATTPAPATTAPP